MFGVVCGRWPAAKSLAPSPSPRQLNAITSQQIQSITPHTRTRVCEIQVGDEKAWGETRSIFVLNFLGYEDIWVAVLGGGGGYEDIWVAVLAGGGGYEDIWVAVLEGMQDICVAV